MVYEFYMHHGFFHMMKHIRTRAKNKTFEAHFYLSHRVFNDLFIQSRCNFLNMLSCATKNRKLCKNLKISAFTLNKFQSRRENTPTLLPIVSTLQRILKKRKEKSREKNINRRKIHARFQMNEPGKRINSKVEKPTKIST